MKYAYVLCVIAALAGVMVGLAAVLRNPKSAASRWFLAGILVLAIESVFGALSLWHHGPESGSVRWLVAAFAVKALEPGCWLYFSLCFSRGDYREFLSRWRVALVASFLVPIGLVAVAVSTSQLLSVVRVPESQVLLVEVSGYAKGLIGMVLAAAVIVLANIEKTFRASMGTARWRMKFIVIGIGFLFGTRVFTLCQSLLFPVYNPSLVLVDSGALLGACCFITIGHLRRGFADLEIYPSRAVLQRSVAVVVAGAYLFLVGVLAELVSRFGAEAFPFQAFVIMLGIAGLGMCLVSDRARVALRSFVSRHFSRPEYDFRAVWSKCSAQFAGVVGIEQLCGAASRLFSETFNALTATVFVIDRNREQFVLVSSTSSIDDRTEPPRTLGIEVSNELFSVLPDLDAPISIEALESAWASKVREASPIQFPNGGDRYCFRLRAGEQIVGLMVLSDRVNGLKYTQEELELLACMADELAAKILNNRLTNELVQAREMEAFQEMSAFFVHDMKNAASSLNLTLQNLPKHFDDPEFRKDALRGIAKTADRIGKLTSRLGELRNDLEIERSKADLNQVVESALAELRETLAGTELKLNLGSLPAVMIDADRIASVVTNLVLNATEALEVGGWVRVETSCVGERVQLCVEDNGSGMTAEFIERSLFRPFRSTKKQGFGIGMFQSRMIVEAHHGTVQVESEPGQGTLFRVSLPAA